ncbi:hypothetical protein ACFL3S_11075 [Gemmatimonadota bacterium]
MSYKATHNRALSQPVGILGLGGVAIFLLMPFLGGCAGGSNSPGSPFEQGPRANSIRIYVTNLNFSDATLWATTPSGRRKLGILTGKRETVYTIPWDYPTNLQIEIDLLAGSKCTTRAMAVDPGDDIELVIDQDLTRSPLCGGGL